ncbi:hypothetical protein CHS0354_010189 [Potamilus streckersoni]|uniref:Uncharacterized protein n=1 Tax=Potamilus streckersoni TaxID=2493646 RepID=A0AAE0RSS1_9BIVA|nr:hypothetical protein CHS0354_010189 [Potamilus streckersoni]
MRGLTIVLFALEFCLCCVLGQKLQYINVSRAYGCWGEHDNFTKMKTNCSDSTVIAVKEVRAGAKLSSIVQCQRPVNKTDNITFFNECCNKDSITSSNDCTFPYDYPNLYDWCSGKRTCDQNRDLHVSNQVIYDCPNGNYGYSDQGTHHSTYMVFKYYCIEEKLIAACPSQSTLEGKVVYLWNDDYISRIAKDCNCSIETQTDNSTIKIYTLHNDLKSNSNNSCIDNASILFTTRNGTTKLQITCQEKHNMTEIFSSYLWMIFSTNTFSRKTNGSFWFAFEATKKTDNVTIKCFSDVNSIPTSGAPSRPPPGLPLVWIIIAVIGSLIFLIILVICCMKCSSDSPARSNQIQSDDIERKPAKSPALVNPGNTKWMMAGPVVSGDNPPSATRRTKRRTKSRNLQENATPKSNVLTTGFEAGAALKEHTNSGKTRKAQKKKKRKKKRKHRRKAYEEQDPVENASTENDALPSKDDGKNADKLVESGGDKREQY